MISLSDAFSTRMNFQVLLKTNPSVPGARVIGSTSQRQVQVRRSKGQDLALFACEFSFRSNKFQVRLKDCFASGEGISAGELLRRTRFLYQRRAVYVQIKAP